MTFRGPCSRRFASVVGGPVLVTSASAVTHRRLRPPARRPARGSIPPDGHCDCEQSQHRNPQSPSSPSRKTRPRRRPKAKAFSATRTLPADLYPNQELPQFGIVGRVVVRILAADLYLNQELPRFGTQPVLHRPVPCRHSDRKAPSPHHLRLLRHHLRPVRKLQVLQQQRRCRADQPTLRAFSFKTSP